MLTIHHLNNSRSQRVLWLLEELGVNYEIKHYERDPKTRRAPKTLSAIHPLGKAPVLTEGGKVIAETGAIIEYIIREHGNGRLVPKLGTEEFENYVHFLHYGEGSAMFPQLLALFTSLLGDAGDPLQPIINQEMKKNFDYMEYHLTGHTYFAGDELSGADFQMIFPLEAAKKHGRLHSYEECINYVNKIHARPAYLRALKRGGHYDYGPSA